MTAGISDSAWACRLYSSPTLLDRGPAPRFIRGAGGGSLEAVSLNKRGLETADDSTTQDPSITAANQD